MLKWFAPGEIHNEGSSTGREENLHFPPSPKYCEGNQKYVKDMDGWHRVKPIVIAGDNKEISVMSGSYLIFHLITKR